MLTRNQLDPITIEVIRNYHQSTARQMRNALIRASFNPIIYEMVDFSLGIYNRDAELIAEGPGIPLFMGTLTFTIRAVMDYLGEENVEDGDAILSTYPYWIGSHSQDAVIIRPIFIDGAIFGYAAAKAHWMDLGAKDVYGIDTTDIWQEGLQLYGVKIVKKGKLDKELVEVVRANSRMPDSVIGDMTAQISACNLGAQRTIDLVAKYGRATVEAATASILDHGEEVARQAIAAMPDGEWTVEAALDDDGISSEPVPLRATIRIAGDEIHVDTSGSAAQTPGPVNCPIASSISAIRLVMKMVVAPHYDANEGFFRPLKVNIPEGSVLNPRPPAPVFLYGWSAITIGEAMFKAFAEVAPGRSVARSGGDMGGLLFSGLSPEDGSFFAGGADECVGQGASIDEDGENAVVNYALGESRNVPAEILEERYPILVEKYELWTDSGGAGKFRGGLGVRRRWRILSDISLISVVEQTKFGSWGVDGGQGGTANGVILDAGTEHARRIGKISGRRLGAGERLDIEMGGGGGWGDPFERDPQAVLADVIRGYVSPESALCDYGVVVQREDPYGYRVDADATAKTRGHRALRSTVPV